MAEKRSEKKWLVLLVILVALSLVVDLISLSVLYNISGSAALSEKQQGALAASWRDDSCVQSCASDCSSYKSDAGESYGGSSLWAYCMNTCKSSQGGYYPYECCYTWWDYYLERCCSYNDMQNGLC